MQKKDVKVPSTSNPEILVCVNACTDEIQNCRQIAATNTVILIDDQIHEASASSEELVSRDVAFIAKGDLEQRHLPIQERSWSVLPCSRDLPKRQPGGRGMQENVIVKERYHGENTSGI